MVTCKCVKSTAVLHEIRLIQIDGIWYEMTSYLTKKVNNPVKYYMNNIEDKAVLQ